MRILLAWLALILAAAGGAGLHAESLRGYHAVVDQPLVVLDRDWVAGLPPEITVTRDPGRVMLAYAGSQTPAALTAFLTAHLPDLAPAALATGTPVSLSVALTNADPGTKLRLLMLGDGPATPLAGLPEGAEILLNDGFDGSCKGQIVLSQTGSQKVVAAAYRAWAEGAGFRLDEAPDQTLSFFVGQRPACLIFLYIEPDTEAPDRMSVVVRYVEE